MQDSVFPKLRAFIAHYQPHVAFLRRKEASEFGIFFLLGSRFGLGSPGGTVKAPQNEKCDSGSANYGDLWPPWKLPLDSGSSCSQQEADRWGR